MEGSGDQCAGLISQACANHLHVLHVVYHMPCQSHMTHMFFCLHCIAPSPQVQPVVRPTPLPDQGQEQAGGVEEAKDKAGAVDRGKEQAVAAVQEVGWGEGGGGVREAGERKQKQETGARDQATWCR